MKHDRFHGRVNGAGRPCSAPGCDAAGEFRAPGGRAPGADGPGEYRWFCLDHIRAFNAGYDYFAGMSADEIWHAQSPIGGWETGSRVFRADAGIDSPPRWADFADPLEALSARARRRAGAMGAARAEALRAAGARADGRMLSAEERGALRVMGLGIDADRRALRTRYAALVRELHPDRNGGDRSHEGRLQRVVEAYQLLRRAAAFA